MAGLALAAGLFGSRLLANDGVETSRSGDIVSQVRVEDDLTVRLSGPDRLTIDEEATFAVEVDGAQEFRWIGPDGSITEGDETLTVRASRAGSGTVTVMATSATTGELVSVEAEFLVE